MSQKEEDSKHQATKRKEVHWNAISVNLVPTDAAMQHRAAESPIHSLPYVDSDLERIAPTEATDSSAAAD